MKFLFKINSGYDGFVPKQLPLRMRDRSLELGWGNYVEAVEAGDEVWVYYKGPHRFENGVYARGRVASVDDQSGRVFLTVHEYAIDQPFVGDPLASWRKSSGRRTARSSLSRKSCRCPRSARWGQPLPVVAGGCARLLSLERSAPDPAR